MQLDTLLEQLLDSSSSEVIATLFELELQGRNPPVARPQLRQGVERVKVANGTNLRRAYAILWSEVKAAHF